MTNSHLNITHKPAVRQCHPLLSHNYFWGEEICVREEKSHSVSPHMAKIQWQESLVSLWNVASKHEGENIHIQMAWTSRKRYSLGCCEINYQLQFSLPSLASVQFSVCCLLGHNDYNYFVTPIFALVVCFCFVMFCFVCLFFPENINDE